MSESERQKKTKKANKHSQRSTHIPIGRCPRGKARTQSEGKEWVSVETKYQIMALNHSRRIDGTVEFQCTDSRIREDGIMASEYTPFCPRYCHRSVLGIRSANKYYIQACVLGKEGGAGDEDENENDNENHVNGTISSTREHGDTDFYRTHRSHRNSLIYLFNTLKINAHRSSSHRLIINRKHGDTEGLEILEDSLSLE